MASDKEKETTDSAEDPSNRDIESSAHETTEQGAAESLSTVRIILILMTLYGLSAASSLGTGLVTIGIPQIAKDLSLEDGLQLW